MTLRRLLAVGCRRVNTYDRVSSKFSFRGLTTIAAESSSCWARSVNLETNFPVNGHVQGRLPEWLNGDLVRNGSGVFQVGQTKLNHLFDGMSVLHRFSIRDGAATYRNRILQSNTLKDGLKANRLTVTQFGTHADIDPCLSTFGRLMSRFEMSPMTDNCSVNVFYKDDALYTVTETTKMRRIDPESLHVVGPSVSVGKMVAVNHSTAHPHVDEDGTVYNMGNSWGGKGYNYNIICFPPGARNGESVDFGGASIVASLPARNQLAPSYYHSFAMTDRFFVFAEMSMIMDIPKMATMNLHRQPFYKLMKFNADQKTLFHLVERSTGKRLDTIYEAPGFFCFHHGNAYEKDGHIVVDLSLYDDGKIIEDLLLDRIDDNIGKSASPYYTRFVLPLSGSDETTTETAKIGTSDRNLVTLSNTCCTAHRTSNSTIYCEPDRLSQRSLELPRINYRLNGKPYRFVYGVSPDAGCVEGGRVLKLDVETGEESFWHRSGVSVSEPIFVARPGAVDEDDGIVLFSALDVVDDRRVLLVAVDAATFKEEGVVEFQAAGTVSKDFHGIFARRGDVVHRY